MNIHSSVNISRWYAWAVSFQHTTQQTKGSHRSEDMRFLLLRFKYFDEAWILVMLERLTHSCVIGCKGGKRWGGKIAVNKRESE